MKRTLFLVVLLATGSLLFAAGGQEAATEDPNELVTLSAFSMQSASSAFGLEEDWIAEIMKEELNVQIEFYPTGDQAEQKFQALMAVGELPDIVGIRESKYAIAAIEAGMLMNLDENRASLPSLYQNPHFKHALNYSRDEISAGKNALYAMPTAVGPLGAIKDTNWKPMLMWDVYEQIGRPEIETLEDYLTVVKQMQDAYPENEYGEKVYGFELFADWDSMNAQQVSTYSFFYGWDSEYVSRLMETHVTDMTIRPMLSDDSFYRRGLEFFFKANQMGLLDPDSITQKFDTVMEKLSAGRVLFTYYSWLTGSFNSRSGGNVNADNPNGYEFVPSNDMRIYDAPYQTIGRTWYYGISSATKYPKHATALLNWLFDIDTQELLSNGPEGILWEKGSDGLPYVTAAGWDIIDGSKEMPLPGGGTLTAPMTNWNTLGYTGGTVNPATGVSVTYRYWPSTLQRNPTKLQLEWQEWSGYKTQIEYMKGEGLISPATQAINMVPAPNDDLVMKMNQIGGMVTTNSWRMIFAKDMNEFNSLWEDIKAKADGLGYSEVVNYYTTEWQKAIAKVSKYTD